ncbi:ATP adenylyltransferase-domain-containing protein [Aspergillus granulosus]|uniref:ATP adenylyltransferase-domain-containing protein n=1 Tax=Aspergillus granulosus TaxID=176169 RepID=A0ABR4H6W3_9EURO
MSEPAGDMKPLLSNRTIPRSQLLPTMASPLGYESILSTFDELVAKKAIFYAPRKTIQFEDTGFVLELHISTSLSKKPQSGEPVSGCEDHQAEKPECFGPGSDIGYGDPGLLLATIRDTHLLVVNKFCMFRPQLLLLTCDSYRRQRDPLELDDLSAACTVMSDLSARPQFVIYNCGPVAGASRQHKHLQVLPRPPRLFPDERGFESSSVPFRYFLQYLDGVDIGTSDGHEKLFEIYKRLLVEAKQAVGIDPESKDHFPHNVALVKEWIIVIPRQKIDVEGITANAAGMLGSVWLTSNEQLEQWKQVGPRKVLAGLGFPNL